MNSKKNFTQAANAIDEIWFLTSELEGERASSFRQERWCRIFLNIGARVRIFNLRGAFGHSDEACSSNDELTEFRRLSLAQYTGPKASVREGFVVRILRRIKHVLLVDLYLPNVIKLLLHTHRLLKLRNEPVVIMASSPPFSVAVVGAILKRLHGPKVMFTVDMRDAWALHNALGGVKPLKRMIEQAVLQTADKVTTVSYGLADEFKQHYGLEVDVMYNVATHYLDAPAPMPVDWRHVSNAIDPTRRQLVYTGSTPEGHYDLKSIVGAMVHLRSTNPDLADRLQFVFVGACDEVRRVAISHDVPLSDIVFIGHLPHSISRSVQASSYALIFLAHFGEKNAGVVSTKLFEYLCLGKPVLPLSLHIDSDVDLLLRRYCGKSLNLHSVEEISKNLARIASGDVEFLPLLEQVDRVRELVDDYRDFAVKLLSAGPSR